MLILGCSENLGPASRKDPWVNFLKFYNMLLILQIMFFGFDSLTGYYFASGTLKVFMDFGPFVPKGPQGPF